MITITLDCIDAYGRHCKRAFGTNRTTYADIASDMATFVAAWVSVSQLGVVKYEINKAVAVDSVPPQPGANLDVGATISLRLDNGKLYPFHIPAIDPSYLKDDGSVDITIGSLLTLLNKFLTGGHFRVSEGNYMASIVRGQLDKR